jgi:hypothetical protein
MRYLITAILGLGIIVLSCWYGSKAILQTDKQHTVTETHQNIVVEEQVSTPDEQISIPEEQTNVDTYNESAKNKYDIPSSLFAKDEDINVLSVDYQCGYRDGYNDGCRGYYERAENWHYSNYLAGYAKGYLKGYAEWSSIERTKYLRKKYSSHGGN